MEPEYPGDGVWGCPVFGFGPEGAAAELYESRWGPPLVLAVLSGDSRWVGSFAAGGLGGLTGAFACPHERRLLAVSDGTGYLADIDRPEAGVSVVPTMPIRQVVAVAGEPLIVVASFSDLTGLGRDGIAWRSRRLCVGDLVIHSASREAIVCEGDNIGGDATIIVDPHTGRYLSGSALPRGWPDP